MNVYDFDNTIYDGESCLDFFFYYLKKQPGLIKMCPKVLNAFYQYKKGRVTIEGALEKYAPAVEDFFAGIEDFSADAEDFWDRHMKNIKPLYKQLQREDDLIISASSLTVKREKFQGFVGARTR